MTTRPTTQELYDRVYRDGWHWHYTRPHYYLGEWLKLRRHLVRRFHLRRFGPRPRVLEVASGQGFHVHLLGRMGFDVTGIDLSVEGVRFARSHYPKCTFVHGDATQPLPFLLESFDCIWSHGAGFFHYDVTTDEVAAIVRQHLQYLRPGGVYAMMISTDLSGRRTDISRGLTSVVWQNTLADYRRMMERHGEHVLVDWIPQRRIIVGPKTGAGLAVAGFWKPLHAAVGA